MEMLQFCRPEVEAKPILDAKLLFETSFVGDRAPLSTQQLGNSTAQEYYSLRKMESTASIMEMKSRPQANVSRIPCAKVRASHDFSDFKQSSRGQFLPAFHHRS
jgi:hypothetical protein